MSRMVWHVGGRSRPTQLVVTAVAAIAFGAVAMARERQGGGGATPAAQAPVKAGAQPVTGEWRSHEQFDNQPRATVVVQDDGGALAGSLTLLGMTRGTDDRATVRVPFRDATWDGLTLSFETALPDGEGKARWTLRLDAGGAASLRLTTDDGKPVQDGPTWAMKRR